MVLTTVLLLSLLRAVALAVKSAGVSVALSITIDSLPLDKASNVGTDIEDT